MLGLAAVAVGVQAVAESPGPAVTVDESVRSPMVDEATLLEIYDDSMDQLRECIDDTRADTDVWAEIGDDRFPC